MPESTSIERIPAVDTLLHSREPSIRCQTLVRVVGIHSDSVRIARLREEIRESRRVQLLLSERDENGRIPGHPYAKWTGAHWVLVALADMGYPAGDQSLIPLREQVLDWLLSPTLSSRLKVINGRVRIHASMEGNAIYALLALGLADGRIEELIQRLLISQWHDGGWNCDTSPTADTSSFMETTIPLRALALHAELSGSEESKEAARRAAEVFLQRRLFRRRRDSSIISHHFLRLHYPCYWHYDILFGLKVMAEAGLIRDERCRGALHLLRSKELPSGGFPAEAKYYTFTTDKVSRRSLVDWGGVSKSHMNEFVTADALHVLKRAGLSH